MAKVLGDDEEGSAIHNGVAGPGVAQLVETNLGDFRSLTRLAHRRGLVVIAPRTAIGLREYHVTRCPTDEGSFEEWHAFILGEGDGEYPLDAAALIGAQIDSAATFVEVTHPQPG